MALTKFFTLFKRASRQQQRQPVASPQGAQPFSQAAESAWESGIGEEVGFWEYWLANGGAEYAEDFRFRFAGDSLLQAHITAVLPPTLGQTVQILDVGAGPLTYLGKQWPGHTVQITAIDPLAETYDKLLQKYRLTPPVHTQKGEGERLVEQFGEDRFDLVHARNCIDHGYDPCRAIEQMVAVTKPGGLVYMHHAVDEAKAQNFQGFHRWNLFSKAGDLFVGNLTREINVSAVLQPMADVETQLFDEGIWMINLIRKRAKAAG